MPLPAKPRSLPFRQTPPSFSTARSCTLDFRFNRSSAARVLLLFQSFPIRHLCIDIPRLHGCCFVVPCQAQQAILTLTGRRNAAPSDLVRPSPSSSLCLSSHTVNSFRSTLPSTPLTRPVPSSGGCRRPTQPCPVSAELPCFPSPPLSPRPPRPAHSQRD